MRIFLNHVDQYIGKHLCSDLRSLHGVESKIFGTVRDDSQPVPECVKRLVPKAESPRVLLKTLLSCTLLVFDLASADLDELMLLLKVMKITKFSQKTVLVIISSVMVWARTKTAFEKTDPDAADPVYDEAEEAVVGDIPEVMPTALTGEDYQKRLPAREYARWKTAETLALSLNSKENMQAYVVCPGLLYGCGESTLLDSMKASWLQMQTATVVSAAGAVRALAERPSEYITAEHDKTARLGAGRNYVPTVHVRDLARVVSILALGEEEQAYLLCVDTSKATQVDLVQGIIDKVGESFAPGVVEPEAFQSPLGPEESWSPDYPRFMAQCDLRVEPCALMQREDFPWWAKEGLVQNLETVASEFCRWRNLRPIRILLGGPPAAGKTTVSAELAQYYGILHIKLDEVMAGIQEKAAAEAARQEAGEEEVDEALVEMNQFFVDGQPLPIQHEARLIRQWLQKNVCKYRGFVLDGYPRNYAEGKELLLQPVQTEEDLDEPPMELATHLCPDFCVILAPPDEVLRDRVLALPQTAVDGTENTEEGFTGRLAQYKLDNYGLGPSVMDFFRERDIRVLEVMSELNVFEAVRLFLESEGRPWNNMPTERFLAAKEFALVEEAQMEREAAKVAAETALDTAEEAVRQQRVTEEQSRIVRLEQSEQAHLEAASQPLQTYFQANVVPILTAGLLETCNIMPEDPVEYMAEYLFEHANDMEVQPLVI